MDKIIELYNVNLVQIFKNAKFNVFNCNEKRTKS